LGTSCFPSPEVNIQDRLRGSSDRINTSSKPTVKGIIVLIHHRLPPPRKRSADWSRPIEASWPVGPVQGRGEVPKPRIDIRSKVVPQTPTKLSIQSSRARPALDQSSQRNLRIQANRDSETAMLFAKALLLNEVAPQLPDIHMDGSEVWFPPLFLVGNAAS